MRWVFTTCRQRLTLFWKTPARLRSITSATRWARRSSLFCAPNCPSTTPRSGRCTLWRRSPSWAESGPPCCSPSSPSSGNSRQNSPQFHFSYSNFNFYCNFSGGAVPWEMASTCPALNLMLGSAPSFAPTDLISKIFAPWRFSCSVVSILASSTRYTIVDQN